MRLAEKGPCALVLKHQQLPLDRPERSGSDIAVGPSHVRCVVAKPDEHRLQILQIHQSETLFVCDAEGDVEHALLSVCQLHHSRQQQWTHLGHGGANRMPALAKEIPEDGRKGPVAKIREPNLLRATPKRLVGLGRWIARTRQARDIALDVLHEHRHSGRRQPLDEDLQRHRLARPGGARDQPVPIGELQQQLSRLGVILSPATHEDPIRRHRTLPLGPRTAYRASMATDQSRARYLSLTRSGSQPCRKDGHSGRTVRSRKRLDGRAIGRRFDSIGRRFDCRTPTWETAP